MVTYLIRGKGTTLRACALWVFAAILLIASLMNGGWREAIWALPFAAVIALCGFIFFWTPHLEANDYGVRVVNLLRITTIPWEDLATIENKYGLYLYAHHLTHKVPVWAISSRAAHGRSALNALKETADPLQWHIDPGTYWRSMNVHDTAEELRKRRAEKYKEYGESTNRPRLKVQASRIYSETELQSIGKKYAEQCNALSTIKPHATNLILIGIALALVVYTIIR